MGKLWSIKEIISYNIQFDSNNPAHLTIIGNVYWLSIQKIALSNFQLKT